jgi:hypothetical protein
MPREYESPAGNGADEALSDGLGTSDFTTVYAIDPIYESKLAGWCEGRASRQAEVDKLNWTADRLYTWALSRTPAKFNDQPAYSSLERVRGNSANANRIDAANAARFEQVTP